MNWPLERFPRMCRGAHFGRVFACFAERPAHLNALFAQTLSRHAADEALVCADRRIKYAELDGIVARVAAGLARGGLRAGDRLAILCANEPEFVFALLAAFRLGAIAVPINVREQTPELAYVLNQCKAREAGMDLQGILGIDPNVRNGFDGIKVHYEIDADATEAQIAALVAQSQKRSAVFDVIANPTDVTVTTSKA
jgi:acyl-CoA synthetase (AMP-forming)/AMP-acid ligase II